MEEIEEEYKPFEFKTIFLFENGNLILDENLKIRLKEELSKKYEEGTGNGLYHAAKLLQSVSQQSKILPHYIPISLPLSIKIIETIK